MKSNFWWRPTLKSLLANSNAALENAKLRNIKLLSECMEEIKHLAERQKALELDGRPSLELDNVRLRLEELMSDVPNYSHPSVPPVNTVQETFPGTATDGRPIRETTSDLVDTEASAKTSGSGFYFLKNTAALLELSLIDHALRKAIKCGFQPVIAPDLVKTELVHKCGFAPRHSKPDPVFRLGGDEGLVLAGTSELALAGMHQDCIIPRSELPKRYVGVSHCFRRELGRGKGIHRVHQFTKVELFILASNQDPKDYLLEEMIPLQKSIMQPLLTPNYTFRLLHMAHDELGASATRKYDLEISNDNTEWKEVSSASDCGEYQAQRLNIKWSEHLGGKVKGYVRTFNATALAVPRILSASLEEKLIPSELQCLENE